MATTKRHSPRRLTLTFELSVPEGGEHNIRNKRIDHAISHLTALVQGALPLVFPWATMLKVRSQWDYAWRDETEVIHLDPPKTDAS